MVADAIKLAVDAYGDATGFVAILQANQLSDWIINAPVNAIVAAPAHAGSTSVTLQPIDNISFGRLIYSNGMASFNVITNVTQNYEVPSASFCVCEVPGSPQKRLPPLGDLLSTTINIAPGLTTPLSVGDEVTIAIGNPTSLTIPPKPPTGGIPV